MNVQLTTPRFTTLLFCIKCSPNNFRHRDDSLILLTASHKLQRNRRILECLGRVVYVSETNVQRTASRNHEGNRSHIAHISFGQLRSRTHVLVWVDQVQGLPW